MKKILLLLFLSTQLSANAADNLIIYRNSTNITPAVSGTMNRVTNSLSDRDFYVPTWYSSEWTSLAAHTPVGLTISTLGVVYKTCLEIKTDYPNAISGRYLLDVYNSGSPAAVYCDMTTDGGGWTLMMKSSGADRTASFNPQTISNNWTTPLPEGSFDNIISPDTTFQDGVYVNMPVQDFMIRSLSDASKKLVWTQGSNSPNLKFMIDNKKEMRGKIFSGGVHSLDYRAGCTLGNYAASTFAGVMVSDHGSTGTSVNFLNGSKVFNDSWVAAMVGWGTDVVDYHNTNNVAGGFGAANMFNYSWNLTRHVHGIGNGCNGSEWAVSAYQGTQTLNPHALFVREGTFKKSCKEINDATPGLPNGVYTIRPDNTNSIQVYCDMANDGGGWTLIMSESFLNFTNDSGVGTATICTDPTKCNTNGTSNFYRGTTVQNTLTKFRFACDLTGNAMNPDVKGVLSYPGNFIRENVLSPGRTLFDLMTDTRKGWSATTFGDERDSNQNDGSRFFVSTDGTGYSWSDGNWHGLSNAESMQVHAPVSWGIHHYGPPLDNGDGTYTTYYSHYCGGIASYGSVFNATQVQNARWWVWVK